MSDSDSDNDENWDIPVDGGLCSIPSTSSSSSLSSSSHSSSSHVACPSDPVINNVSTSSALEDQVRLQKSGVLAGRSKLLLLVFLILIPI